ncbi:MAG: hypothetical protein ACOCP4_04400 [Candidatus Woesearchaeota archaeon]
MELEQLYPLMLKIIIILIVFLVFLNYKYITGSLKKVKKKIWLLMFLVFIIGLLVRLFLIPHTHYVYYDSFEHVNMAQNIHYSNKYCTCNYGAPQECYDCMKQPWPGGYHTLQSLVFDLFHASEKVVFNTTAVIASISIILFFILIYLITQDSVLALFGASIFSLNPVHLKLSGSPSLMIYSIFFILLSMIFLEIFIAKKKFSLFFLFLTTLLYTTQTRSENLLLFFIFTAYILARYPEFIGELLKPKYLLILLLTGLMLFFFVHFMENAHKNLEQSEECGELFSTKLFCYFSMNNLMDNILPNILYFMHLKFNALFLFLLSIPGGFKLYKENKKQLAYYLLFFIAFFILFASYHIGNFTYVDSFRYMLPLFIPLILMSTYGIKFFLKKAKFNKGLLILLFIMIYSSGLIFSFDFIKSEIRNDNFYDCIKSVEEKLPRNAHIIAYNPRVIMSTIEHNSMQLEFISAKNLREVHNTLIFFEAALNPSTKQKLKTTKNNLMEYYDFKLIEKNTNCAFYNMTRKNS